MFQLYENNGVIKRSDVDKIVNSFTSEGGLKHDFQHYKLWE